MLGKTIYKCKYHSRFGCWHFIRKYDIDGIEVLEESGTYICDNASKETRKIGLPKYVKDTIIKKMEAMPNIKPKKIFKELIVKEENKYAFSKKEIVNFIKVQKRNKSEKSAFYQNTVEGVKK